MEHEFNEPHESAEDQTERRFNREDYRGAGYVHGRPSMRPSRFDRRREPVYHDDTGYDRGGYGYGPEYDPYGMNEGMARFSREHGAYRSGSGARYQAEATDERLSFRGVGPKGYHRSDARIEEEICERLSDHDDIDASDILVSVEAAVVTLQGTVPDRLTKRLAEDVADSIAGVTDVQNQLRIAGGSYSSTRAGEDVNDNAPA